MIEVFNASGLCFSVLPGRALDIASAHYKGMSLCFRSSTGDVGPAFYEPQGNGWLRGFYGGLVVTCGMTFTGHPEVDPEEENEELGLHGRLAFLPAKNVVANAGWEGEQYVVRVHGKMREAVVFGTNLELTREISTALGEKSIHIHDRIENLSVDPSPLMFVYHCNPGFPVLDSGTRLLINSEKTTEWLEDREVGPEVYAVAKPPQEEARDDVFVHRPVADADGKVQVGLVNDALGAGAVLEVPDRRDAAGEPVAAFSSRHVRDGCGAGQREHVGAGVEPQGGLSRLYSAGRGADVPPGDRGAGRGGGDWGV